MSTQINVASNGKTVTFNLANQDFSESRDKAALRIGREVVDAIYDLSEGGN